MCGRLVVLENIMVELWVGLAGVAATTRLSRGTVVAGAAGAGIAVVVVKEGVIVVKEGVVVAKDGVVVKEDVVQDGAAARSTHCVGGRAFVGGSRNRGTCHGREDGA